MAQEKTGVEIIAEFAEKTGRKMDLTEHAYKGNAVHPVVYHHRIIYMANNAEEKSYFVCFSNPKDVTKYGMYCGVFFPVKLPKDSDFIIRKKDIVDKLNPFAKGTAYKTSNPSFDKKALVSGENLTGIEHIINNTTVQDTILELFKLDMRFLVGANAMGIDFVPGLKGESHFGVFIARDWLFDSNVIEQVFAKAEMIRKSI